MITPNVLSASLLLALGGALGCLPEDTRTPPGKALITISASDFAVTGIPASAVEDGFSIAFDKFLMSIDGVWLSGFGNRADCEDYSDSRYGRIVSLTRPGAQKLALVHALGRCGVNFGAAPPSGKVVRGEGVTQADEDFLRSSDLRSEPGLSGAGIYLEGRAENGALSKRFQWTFGTLYSGGTCGGSFPSPLQNPDFGVIVVQFASEATVPVGIVVRPEVLFRTSLDGSKPTLSFSAFARADTEFGNNDGLVTLDELARVPPPSTRGPANLLQYLIQLAAMMARIESGADCVPMTPP